MDESREHERVPFGMQVEFRTASSFLVAYSVNISRGGIFLETADQLPIGSELTLALQIPGAQTVEVTGKVTWHRGDDDIEGPAGMGVEFVEMSALAGEMIDDLVTGFEGLTILLVCTDDSDRSVVTRQIRSIFGSATVLVGDEDRIAEALVDDDVDLAVIDVDADSDAAVRSLRLAAGSGPEASRIPTVALAGTERLRLLAHEAGADEVGTNPPQFREFHKLLIRAMSRPARIKSTD